MMKIFCIYIGLLIFLFGCKSSRLKQEKVFVVPTDVIITPQTTKLDISCDFPFKSLESFRRDTLAFLRYNLGKRKNCYLGKPLYTLLSELNLPVKSYIPDARSRPQHSKEGIFIDFFETDSLRSLYSKNKIIKSTKIKLIYFKFNNVISKKEINSTITAKHGKWDLLTKAYYENKSIEDIRLAFY